MNYVKSDNFFGCLLICFFAASTLFSASDDQKIKRWDFSHLQRTQLVRHLSCGYCGCRSAAFLVKERLSVYFDIATSQQSASLYIC